MSDLDAFFAKKDKKKKGSGRKSKRTTEKTNRPTETSAPAINGTSQQQSQSDDGWIDFEDPRGAQVNTGGRTVVEIRRNGEEKEASSDNATQTEKFSGWAARAEAVEEEAAQRQKEEEEKNANKPPLYRPNLVQTSSTTAFPTLADAAKVKVQKPTPSSEPKKASSMASNPYAPSSRPRLVNSNTEKLRQKIADRNAALGK